MNEQDNWARLSNDNEPLGSVPLEKGHSKTPIHLESWRVERRLIRATSLTLLNGILCLIYSRVVAFKINLTALFYICFLFPPPLGLRGGTFAEPAASQLLLYLQ